MLLYDRRGDDWTFADFFIEPTDPSVLGTPSILFSDAERGARLDIVLSRKVPTSSIDRRRSVIRIGLEFQSTCRARTIGASPGREIPVSPTADGLGRAKGAFDLVFERDDGEIEAVCSVNIPVHHTSYSARYFAVQRWTRNPWHDLKRVATFNLQLNEPYVDRVEVETDGTKLLHPLGTVALGPTATGAVIKWIDQQAEMEENWRLWGSAALIGVGFSMLIEAFRGALDG